MANSKNRNTAANAATEAPATLASVLASIPATARSSAPVTPPKQPGSACGRAWVLAAYAAKAQGKKPTGEELRKLAEENALNTGNVTQEASRYYRWLAQQGHGECSGILPESWKISL